LLSFLFVSLVGFVDDDAEDLLGVGSVHLLEENFHLAEAWSGVWIEQVLPKDNLLLG